MTLFKSLKDDDTVMYYYYTLVLLSCTFPLLVIIPCTQSISAKQLSS